MLQQSVFFPIAYSDNFTEFKRNASWMAFWQWFQRVLIKTLIASQHYSQRKCPPHWICTV